MMRRVLALVLVAGAAMAASPLVEAGDPIRPIPLISGQPDTLHAGDLFVTDLPMTFESTPSVSAEFDAGSLRLVLTPSADFEGLGLVPVRIGDHEHVVPVRARRLIEHTFSYDDPSAERVHVIGQFNDWSRTASPMNRQADGSWSATLHLDPGRYEYKFTVDGAEVLDPGNAVRVPNPFGDFNNILVIPPRHARSGTFHIAGFEDGEVAFAFDGDQLSGALLAESVVVLLDNSPVSTERVSVGGDSVRVRADGLPDGVLRIAATSDGWASRFASVRLVDGAPVPGDTFTWRDAIIYQIMVDRFHDGDPTLTAPVAHDSVAARANFHGGDLQGILDKIEEGYFDRLGVNTLWLSPVIQNTERAHREYPPPHRYYTGYHGYWPTHPTQVDHRFGDMELLRRVTTAARDRGIRVLLDFVANHVHEDHPYFQNNREWFGTLELPDGRKNLRLWDEQRLTTWFEPYLPSFDFEGSPEAIDVMTDTAIWWLSESGADGFRHDAVKHIPNPFWRTLTRKVRWYVDPDRELRTFQIGETFGSYDLIASYVNPGQMDSQFNFNLYDAALHVFLDPDADFSVLDAEMHRTLDVHGQDHVMGNLMDSHDKPRFPALVEGHVPGPDGDDKEVGWRRDIVVEDAATYDRVELYLAYLLTIPGVPTLYYGNEIGMTGANDPDNRRPMRFGEEVTPAELALKERVTRLVRLRQESSELRRGGFHTLYADGDLWAYLRADVSGRTVIVLNKGSKERSLTLDIPAALATPSARDAITHDVISAQNGTLTASIPANGYRILTLDTY